MREYLKKYKFLVKVRRLLYTNRMKYLCLYSPEKATKFLYEKRNLSTHPNPCCSRKCGGIKSHWK